MKRAYIPVAIIWILCLLLIGWAVYTSLDILRNTLPAVIAGVATLLAAIGTHLFTEMRDQQQRELQLKQENYKELVKLILPFIRGDGANRDELNAMKLHSCVVGSPAVIRASEDFTIDPH